MTSPWDRRDHESARAYEAFQSYLGLGAERSYARVGELLGKSEGLIERWGSKHRWQERARAYDDKIAIETMEQMQSEILDMNRRHISTAKELQAKAVARLESMDVDAMTPRDVVTYFESAVKIERLARGEVTDKVAQHSVHVTMPSEVTHETEEERDDRMMAVARELLALGVLTEPIKELMKAEQMEQDEEEQ